MKRLLNWTDRKRIPIEAASIRLIDTKAGVPRRFEANLSDLANLGLDPKSRVIIEPYVKASSMRFDFGTLEQIVQPGNTFLTDIDAIGAVMFRVRIVDTSIVPGRLLASVERIQARDDGEATNDRRALLPLKEADLGEGVWEVSLKGPRPMLVVNRRIPEIAYRMQSEPLLQGAVFPSALRQILLAIALDSEVDSESDWVTEWTSWAEALVGAELPEGDDQEVAEQFVEAVVEKFVSINRFVTRCTPNDVRSEAAYD